MPVVGSTHTPLACRTVCESASDRAADRPLQCRIICLLHRRDRSSFATQERLAYQARAKHSLADVHDTQTCTGPGVNRTIEN
jgi:hypothetical protein